MTNSSFLSFSCFLFWAIGITMLLQANFTAAAPVAPRARARAFFVFGDSLVDNGNNNYLATSARADSPPYGIDYPTGQPTGRFSNGKHIPDFISEAIGSEPTLPYLNPALTGNRLLVGANFASAGVGVLNDTGIQFVNIIRMFRQLEYFSQYQQRVRALIGAEEAERLIRNSITLITVGGNDFVNNYYLVPFSPRSRQYPLPQYVRYVISEYRKLLLQLHNLGAQRILVTGAGQLGCVPAERALRGGRNGQCSPDLQRAAQLYDPQLLQMLNGLNSEVGRDVFIAANINNMNTEILNNPRRYGFVTSTEACCGQGPNNGLGLCRERSDVCPDRDLYVFWDAFHPSEKACSLIAEQIMTGSTDFMSPMNLSTVMAIDSTRT